MGIETDARWREQSRRPSLPSPAFFKAPLLLFRFPGVLVAVVAAALVLGIAAASSSLFLSSAGNEALSRELGALTPTEAGLSIATYGPTSQEMYDAADSMLAERTGRIEALGDPFRRIVGDSVRVVSPDLPSDPETRVRVMFREGAEDNIQILDEAGVEGVYLPDTVAEAAGVQAGDELGIRFGQGAEKVPIAGIYKDLRTVPLNDYWSPMTFEILPVNPNQPAPLPLVIAPRDLALDVSAAVGLSNQLLWEMPLDGEGLTLEEAQRVLAEEQSLELDVRNDETGIGQAFDALTANFGGADFESGFTRAVRRVEDTVVSITGPVELLSLAGRAVALIVFAAAGVFAVQRRRVEVRLLSSQGVSPRSQGLRAALESFLPALLGVVAGWGLAYYLVRAIGPTSELSAGVARDALITALQAGVIAVVLYGVVTMLGARREVESGSARFRGIVSRLPWEAIVLALAAASFYEIVTRGEPVITSAEAAPKVDIFLLLFPILFITGMAGVAGRGLRRVLPSIRRMGDRSAPPLYLASRRLAGASRIALLLVTATSISLGILVYASVLVSSNETTAQAKANISVGSDVAVPVQLTKPEQYLGIDLPFPGSLVARTDDGDIKPGDIAVDTLGVDPETFPNTAFFDGSFASEGLDELVGRLEEFDGNRLTAIVVAAETEIPEGSIYVTPRYDVPIEVVATANAWPGLSADRPMLVARSDALIGVSEEAGSPVPEELISNYEVWSTGSVKDVRDGLLSNEILFNEFSIRSTEELLSTPSFLALRWTFSYLEALGVMAGAIALAGMLLYLQTRQQAREVSYALARRMGLTRGDHRKAVALELGGMLIVSLLIGASVALLSSLLIYSRLDPLPTVPPDPLFAIPPVLFLVLVPVIALAALLGAWRVQRKADTANVAEVLRYAA
ncbi:MAG: FtsX-like permease family protein [Actinomycetota bacterium]